MMHWVYQTCMDIQYTRVQNVSVMTVILVLWSAVSSSEGPAVFDSIWSKVIALFGCYCNVPWSVDVLCLVVML